MLFLGDLDDGAGDPIPSRPSKDPILPPTMDLPRFPVLGAGLQYAARQRSIPPGPSGHIPTRAELANSDPKREFLAIVRSKIDPIYQSLKEVKRPEDRKVALKAAFDLLRPGSDTRIERMSYDFVARGMPASLAFREALTREVAATILTLAADDGSVSVPEVSPEGLGGFWSSIKGAAKTVVGGVKSVVKVAASVVGTVKDIACNRVVGKIAGGVTKVVAGSDAGRTGTKKVCGVADTVLDVIGERKKSKPKPSESGDRIVGSPPPFVVGVSKLRRAARPDREDRPKKKSRARKAKKAKRPRRRMRFAGAKPFPVVPVLLGSAAVVALLVLGGKK